MHDDRRVPLEDVITTRQLYARPSRTSDYEAENHAIAELMEFAARQPAADDILQKLVETVCKLCRAHSAGVSILEKQNGHEHFRWRAVAGARSSFRGATIPRVSPCGTVLDRGMPIVMNYPERHYRPGETIALPIVEALLVPLILRGKPVGTVWIVAHDESRQFETEDLRLITNLSRFAATVYQVLSHEALAAQLAGMQQLQEISTQLLGEDRVEGLYQKIMDAAASIMHTDFASLQVFDPQLGPRGQLRLLAFRGFTKEAARGWKYVSPEAKTSCAVALSSRTRVIVPDVANSEFMAGSDDQAAYLQAGVRAVQTTPLISRNGHLVGMLSTHWRHPCQPREQDLLLLDVLARQAADLIERSLTEEHTRLLVREVSHRAKNMLAVVQGIVQQTVGEGDSKVWARGLSSRLSALAASQELLLQNEWHGVEIDALICSQLQHLSTLVGTRILFDGLSLRIAPFAAQTLGMAFHELATNAVKYGALSNDGGMISIQWVLTGETDPRVLLTWKERGGPAVTAPVHHGYGMEVTVPMVEHALDASVDLDYHPAGLNWRVNAPAATILAAM